VSEEIQRLFPDPGTMTPAEAAASLGLQDRDPGDRPWVAANMVSTADGRATIAGKSGALGNAADHEQFAALRKQADCVLVGPGTVAIERYGPMIRDTAVREERARAGLSPQPICAMVTRSGRLPLDAPLFDDPDQTVIVHTEAEIELDPVRAQVEVNTLDPLTLEAALRHLHTHHGVRVVLCEGGPRLLGALIAAGLLDELCLTFSPLVAGGNGTKHVTEAPDAVGPVPLDLVRVLEDEGLLFLTYLVRGRAA
jgi:riboflavin biosynthesis pyrimidine reductase